MWPGKKLKNTKPFYQLREKAAVIKKIRSTDFWNEVTVAGLEEIRLDLGGIMKYVAKFTYVPPTPRFIDIHDGQEQYQRLSTQFNNMGMLYMDRDRSCPTHAALLLSDVPARKTILSLCQGQMCPLQRHRNAGIPGSGDDGRTALRYNRATIEPCMAFIKKNIALGATIGEVYRKDRWEYPLEAIREALINAVIHRDYAILGSDVKVAIYDDMLEITSPGPLPDALSIEDLGSGRSEIRNRVLAPIFEEALFCPCWKGGF